MSNKSFRKILETIILGTVFSFFFVFTNSAQAAILSPGQISSCGELAAPGTYTLSASFDADSSLTNGTCFVITSDNVTINGNHHTASTTQGGLAIDAEQYTNPGDQTSGLLDGGNAFTNLTVLNINFVGFSTGGVNASGAPDTDNNGSNGGWGGNSGNVTIVNSTMGDINANGGDADAGNWWSGYGSAGGGTITISDSTVGNINANGGNLNGYSNYSTPGNGGNISISNSTTGTSILANSGFNNGGANYYFTGGNGGTIYISGTNLNLDNTTVSAAGGSGDTSNGYGNGTSGTFTILDSGTTTHVNISLSSFSDLNINNTDWGAYGGGGWPLFPGSISSCGTLSFAGTYTLTGDITGVSGTCFTVVADGVTIDGAGHTVTGTSGYGIYAADQNGDGGNGHSITVNNITLTGFGQGIIASGSDGNDNSYNPQSGGSGGSITVASSSVGSIFSYGGNGADDNQNSYTCSSGGSGGTISITNSTFSNYIYAYGGNGGSSYGCGGNGGNGGSVTISGPSIDLSNMSIALAGGGGGSYWGYYGGGSSGTSGTFVVGDSGSIWSAQTGSGQHNWTSVTSSSDGSKLAAVDANGYIYTSTDSGGTWVRSSSSVVGAGGGSATMNNGLLAYWKLDEVSGARHDSTSNHLDLTPYGTTITSSSGVLGQAANVPVNSYLAATDNRFSSARSVCGWLKLSASNGSYQRFILGGTVQIYSDHHLAVDYDHAEGPSTINPNQWYFICIIVNGSNLNVWLNGNSEISTAWPYGSFGNTIQLGSDSYVSVSEWLDEFGVWNRALSSQEISQLYNSGSGRTYSSSAGQIITSSSDGSKLAAVDSNSGYIYTSTNSGSTWTQQTGSGQHSWTSITSSSDGSKLVAADGNNGYIYTSTNSGVTWTQQTGSGQHSWSSITSSSDGVKLAAADNGGYIYTSTNSGVTWTQQTGSGQHSWSSITSSSDGVKLAAADNGGYIYTSTNSGVTWTAQTSSGQHSWVSMTSSSNGSKLAAVDASGYITSSDSGVTWTPRTGVLNRNWSSITSSSDGSKLIASDSNNGYIYTSNLSQVAVSSVITHTNTILSSLSDLTIDGTDWGPYVGGTWPVFPGSISSCGTIAFPGTYTLTQDITGVSGTCFTVVVDGVTIDGAGHTISVASSIIMNNMSGTTDGKYQPATGQVSSNGGTAFYISYTDGNSINDTSFFQNIPYGSKVHIVGTLFDHSPLDATLSVQGSYGTGNAQYVYTNGSVSIPSLNGGSYTITITKNLTAIDASSQSSSNNGHSITVNNLNTTGFLTGINANGANGGYDSSNNPQSGTNGGNIIVASSTLGAVTSNGGTGADDNNWTYNSANGGSAGTISITDSTVSSISASGGNGGSGPYPGNGGSGSNIAVSGSNIDLINTGIYVNYGTAGSSWCCGYSSNGSLGSLSINYTGTVKANSTTLHGNISPVTFTYGTSTPITYGFVLSTDTFNGASISSTPRTLYYENDNTSDPSWDDSNNWFTDSGYGTPAMVNPRDGDTVYIDRQLDNPPSTPITLGGIIVGSFNGGTFGVNLSNTTGTSTFDGNNFNYGSLTGDAVFNNTSFNAGTVTGNASFHDSSINSGTSQEGWPAGTVTGTCSFYDASLPGDGTCGSIIYHKPFYFSNATSTKWDDLANWWFDQTYTLPAPYLPQTSDTVYITTSMTAGPSTPVTLGKIYVEPSWKPQASAGQRYWLSITSSSDGTKLAAVNNGGYIYTSTDSGITWTQRLGSGVHNWWSITSSSDGTKLAVVDQNNGYIYTSTSSGATWTQQTGSGQHNWQSITSSSDGVKLAAGDAGNGYIYTSTNSGATWIQQTGSGQHGWRSITSSSDGTKLAAVDQNNGYIYTSTNSGSTWTQQTNSGQHYWQSIASSVDGVKLAAVASGGYIYTSTNSGVVWTQQTNSGQHGWSFITSSSDGTKLAAVDNGGSIYVSSDSGITWTVQTSAGQHNWYGVTSSSDGTKLAAVDQSGYIYTYTSAPFSADLTNASANDIYIYPNAYTTGAVNAGTFHVYGSTTLSSVVRGTLTGNVEFNDTSDNDTNLSGNATFNGSSYNATSSSITGLSIFNNLSRNFGTLINAIFNGSSYNAGTISSSTFNGLSYNLGTSTTAFFNDLSHNAGW
ncbi:MAG: hypothetical protein WCI52_04250, partial [bacterium]